MMFNSLKTIVRFGAAAVCTLVAAGTAWADPTGACCRTNSSGATTCAVQRHNVCHFTGGQFQGNNTACGPNNTCPTGACCLTDSLGVVTCAVRTRTGCEQADGRFRGIDAACSSTTCPPLPTGACCVTGSSGAVTCSIQNNVWCRHFSGRYQGNNIACGPNGTCTPRGACCSVDTGFCEVKIQARCAGAGRTYSGDNTVCVPNSCPQPPRGACCVTVGTQAVCFVARPAGCSEFRGTYQGDNTNCTSNPCPAPVTGACCVAATATRGARCAVVTSARCTELNGAFHSNASCAAAGCPSSCACDWDHNGFLSAHDSAAFLNDWLAGHGDFNHDGATNNQDLSDFLACYNSAPTGCFRFGSP